YNFIISFGQNFIILAALGIPIYGMREIAKIGDDRTKRSKLFWELITLHLIFTCLLLIIYCASIYLYADLTEYKGLALLGGALILLNVFSFEWLFSGLNDFKYITLRSLVIRTISIFTVFLLVKEKNDYFIYLLITTITVL